MATFKSVIKMLEQCNCPLMCIYRRHTSQWSLFSLSTLLTHFILRASTRMVLNKIAVHASITHERWPYWSHAQDVVQLTRKLDLFFLKWRMSNSLKKNKIYNNSVRIARLVAARIKDRRVVLSMGQSPPRVLSRMQFWGFWRTSQTLNFQIHQVFLQTLFWLD